MALRVYRDTISQLDYLKSKAQTSALYDEKQYQSALAKGTEAATNYLGVISSNIGNKDLGDFSYNQYKTYRDGEDAALYLYTKTMVDKDKTEIDEETGEVYNVYERNMAYLNDIYKRNVAQDIYDGLSAFEKTFHSTVGFVGKIFSDIYSIGENLLDAVTFIAEGVTRIVDDDAAKVIRDFGAKDITGARALENAILDYHNKYTFWDKNALAKITMDVASGIAKMAPMLLAGPMGYAAKIGSSLYYAAAAGATYNETIQANPDINYANLFAYVAGTTAVEWGTEKFSGLFGDTAIDAIFKGAGSVAGTTGLNVFAKVGLDSLTEGIEEGVSEFFGGLLNHWLVDPSAPAVSLEDILYASLIGGITGGVMTTANVASTPRLGVTNDGEIDYASDLRAEGKQVTKTLNGFKSYKVMSLLARIDATQATNVANLKSKYNMDESTLRTKHAEEFDRAETKDIEIRNKKYEAAAKLSSLMEKIGATKFENAIKVLEQAEAASQEKINNYKKAQAYINVKTGKAAVYEKYKKEFEAANPGANIELDMNPSDEFKRIANAISNKYGIAVLSGTIGQKDGSDVPAITTTSNAIILDSKLVEQMSYQQLFETVIKQKLTDVLMNDQIMNDKKAIKTMLEEIIPYDNLLLKPIPDDIKKVIAERLLFDDIAIENVFLENKSAFRKMIDWIHNRIKQNKMFKQDEFHRIQYRELLKARERYINAVVRNIGNESDAKDAKALFVMSDEEYVSKIRGRYITTANNKQVALMRINMTPDARKKYQAIDELLHARKGADLVTKIDWQAATNPEYFTRDFQDKVRGRYSVDEAPNWEDALWAYLYDTYGIAVDFRSGATYKAVQLAKKLKKDVIGALEYVIQQGGYSEALSGFEYMKEIFTEGVIKELSGVDLSAIRIHFVKNMKIRGQTQVSQNGAHIDCYVKIQNSVEATIHTLLHEVIHALCQLNGLPRGTSLHAVKNALSSTRPSIVRFIGNRILGPEHVKTLAPDEERITDDLLTEVAYAVYLCTPGEMLAEGKVKEVFATNDWFSVEEKGSFTVYHGYGKFAGLNFFGQRTNEANMAEELSAATVGIERIKAKWATEEEFMKATKASKELAKAIYRNKWSEAEYLRVALNPDVNVNVRQAMILAAYKNNKVIRTNTALQNATTKNPEIGTSPMVAAIALHKAKASLKSGDFSWMFNNAAMASFSTFAKEKVVETKDKKTYSVSAELIKQKNTEKEAMINAVKRNAKIINSVKQNSTEAEILEAFSKIEKDDAKILSYPIDMLLYVGFANKSTHTKVNSLFDIQKYLLQNDFDYSSSSAQTMFDALYKGLADWDTNDVGGSIEHEGKDGESDGIETYEYFAGLQEEEELLRDKYKAEEKPVDKELESVKEATNMAQSAANKYKEWLDAPPGEQDAERKAKLQEIENAIVGIKRILDNPNITIGPAARAEMEKLVSGEILLTAIDDTIDDWAAIVENNPEQDGAILDKLGWLGNQFKDLGTESSRWVSRYGKEFAAKLKSHVPAQKTLLKRHGLTAKEEIQYIKDSIKKGEYISRSSTGRASNMTTEYLDKKAEASKTKAELAKTKEATKTQLHGIELIKTRAARLEQLRYTEEDLKKAEAKLEAAVNRNAPEDTQKALSSLVNDIKTAPEQREKLLDRTIKDILHESGLEYTTNMSDAKEIVNREYGIETKTIKEDKEYLFTKDGYEYSIGIVSNPHTVREDLGRMVYSLVTGKSIKGGSLTKKSTAPATKAEVEKKTQEHKDSKKSVSELKSELSEVKKKLATYTHEKRKQVRLDGAAKILGVAPNEIDRADLITYGQEAADAFDAAKQKLSHRVEELETLIDEKSSKKTETRAIEEKQAKESEVKKEVDYDFRRIQEESRKELAERSWSERSTTSDESLRSRLSTNLQREMERRGYYPGSDNELILDNGKGTSFRVYKNVDAVTFRDMFEISRTYTRNGELVDLHDIEDTEEHGVGYKNTTNYLSEDGMSGFAIAPDGDLISVFNANTSKKGFLTAIGPIIKKDAKRLDCYVSKNQNLQEMYSKKFGFKTASIMDWNADYDHDDIGINHDDPKVAFMVNTSNEVVLKEFNKDQYDQAQAYQKEQAYGKQQPVVDEKALKEQMTALAKKKTSKKKTTTTVEKTKTEPVVAEQETQPDIAALKSELASVNEEIAQYEGKNAKAYTKMLAARELGLSESEVTDRDILDFKTQAIEELKELKKPLLEKKEELEQEIEKLEPTPKTTEADIPPIEEYTLPPLTDEDVPLDMEEVETQTKSKETKKAKPKTVDKSIVLVEHPRQKIDPTKKYTNDEKIAILEDKSYRTTVRESEAKRTQDMTDKEYIEYMAASVSLFDDAKFDALVQIKTDEDYNTVLDAIEDGRLTGTEAVCFLTWAETYGYRLAKETHERISKLLKKKVTESAQNIGIRRWLVDKGYFSATVRQLNNTSDKDFALSQTYVDKYLPELMNKELALKELDQQIKSLEQQLEKVTDALEHEQLEKERLDKIHKANMIAREDQIGLLNDKIKELESRETDKSKAQEEVTQMINEATAEMAAFAAEHTIPTPPKSGSVLSPLATEKVANFLEQLESWRYLALLSNPATWGRNAITNTLVAANAVIEDSLGKLFTKWDRNKVPKYVKRAGYYGDYDESFKTLTEEMFGAKIKTDTQSSKYDTQQFKTEQKEYQEAKRKLRQPKFMTWAQEKEMVVLSDQRWVGPRTMKNLRGMIAGSRDLLLEEAMNILQTKYGVRTETLHELVDHIKETNKDIAGLLDEAGNGNLNSLLKLSYELNKGKTKDGRIAVGGLLGDIYSTALYRGNELFFKVDTALSNVISNISKNHRYVGMGIRALVPFVRTTINTGMYMLSHSPAGLALGVKRLLQNKRSNFNDMRAELSSMLTSETGSFKKEYEASVKEAKQKWIDSKQKESDFKEQSFTNWLKENYREEYDIVYRGSDKNIQKTYEKYLAAGMVMGNSVGLSDVFGRAAAMEKFSQGAVGTAMLVLGVILGCILDIEIDEEDIYGPVMRIGDIKIALDDLSPATTIFTLGTVLTSSKVDEKWNELWQIVCDQSIFGVLDSAIKFNDGVGTFLETASINYMQQLIPSALKSITKWTDQGKKDKSGNLFDKAWKTTLSNLPGFSYLVPNKINPYTGKTEKYYNTWYGAIPGTLSPFTVRVDKKSDLEKAAIQYEAESAGLSGRFTYNGKDYAVTGKAKENLAKYRADYIQSEYDKIVSGKKLVTVETSDGKRLTTKWEKLDDSQKQTVLKNLYSDASNKSKVKYWVVDLGNTYKTSSKTEYQTYYKLFGNRVQYDANWSKSKFLER